MRFGLYAPFNRSETTAMAVRLGDFARRQGWRVDWLAPAGSISPPVHPSWDGHVGSAALPATWAAACDVRAWFVPDARAFLAAKHAAKSGTRDVLILPWHAAGDLGWVHQFDEVVFASCFMQRRAQPGLAVALHGDVPLRVCEWSPEVRPRLRCGPLSAAGYSALLCLDNYTARRCGHEALHLCDRLLHMPKLTITLAFDGTLDRWEKRTIGRLMSLYDRRLRVDLRPSLAGLLADVARHDWLVYPALRATCGMLVVEARALGVPTIAWDVTPMRGVIAAHQDGLLAVCDKGKTDLGAETAVWDTHALWGACAPALCNQGQLVRMQTACFRRGGWGGVDFDSYWKYVAEVQHAA